MESFWIAEKFENGRSAGYFAGGDMFKDFITDIEQALQFRRKRDAERVIGFMFGDVRATEHCYMDGHDDLLSILKAINVQFDCPARNTNRGYRYAEATVVSSDLRQQVKEAIAKAELK